MADETDEGFVNVRLSEVGKQIAGDAILQVCEGHHRFHFRAGDAQRVKRLIEWENVLKTQCVDGHPLFEITDDAAVEPPVRPSVERSQDDLLLFEAIRKLSSSFRGNGQE